MERLRRIAWRTAVTALAGLREGDSACFKGISGKLRAVGWPRIDDRRSPRGYGGRGKSGARQGATPSPSPSSRQAAKRPGSLPSASGSPSFRAVPGEVFRRPPKGWLRTS